MSHNIRRVFSRKAFAAVQIRQLSVAGSSLNQKSNRLDGKVAIVTASTAGIGYAIAEGLAENGASVVISSRKEENVEECVNKLADKGLSVIGCVCHVGDKANREVLVKKAVDTYGKLDVLVSNAGISPVFGPLLETEEKAWDKIFDLNLKSSFLMAQAAAPYLKESKGSIIFNSSIGGYQPFPLIGAYSISKTALLGLVKALAMECAPLGVRVNGIAPGIIQTDFSSALTDTPQLSKSFLKNIPMGRFGISSEIAGTAVFLSSDEASYITGETIVIAGGAPSRL